MFKLPKRRTSSLSADSAEDSVTYEGNEGRDGKENPGILDFKALKVDLTKQDAKNYDD